MLVECELSRMGTKRSTVVEEVGCNTEKNVLQGRQEASRALYTYVFQLNLRILLIN